MGKYWHYYASYQLWSQFSPGIKLQSYHCDRKRGYQRARKKESLVKELLMTDSTPQWIGKLAQRAIYEFHNNLELLSQEDGIEKVSNILDLDRQLPEVKERLIKIIGNYYEEPKLLNKKILVLQRGDESFPEAIPISYGNFTFGLYAAFDCVIQESIDTIHVIDFKTGKYFDRRQAFVYLVAAKYLYPDKQVIASFYNLETQECSDIITLSSEGMESIIIELSLIAKNHQEQLSRYKNNPQQFDRIYPARVGGHCKYCSFSSICQYAQID